MIHFTDHYLLMAYGDAYLIINAPSVLVHKTIAGVHLLFANKPMAVGENDPRDCSLLYHSHS